MTPSDLFLQVIARVPQPTDPGPCPSAEALRTVSQGKRDHHLLAHLRACQRCRRALVDQANSRPSVASQIIRTFDRWSSGWIVPAFSGLIVAALLWPTESPPQRELTPWAEGEVRWTEAGLRLAAEGDRAGADVVLTPGHSLELVWVAARQAHPPKALTVVSCALDGSDVRQLEVDAVGEGSRLYAVLPRPERLLDVGVPRRLGVQIKVEEAWQPGRPQLSGSLDCQLMDDGGQLRCWTPEQWSIRALE